MRFFMGLGLTILLSGCATSTTNYYTQTVAGWRGGNVKSLLKRWGMPDERIISPSGSVLYLYKTESYRTYNGPSSPAIGVNYSRGGRPVIVNTPNTNTTWDRGALSITCMAAFEVNPRGEIINTQVQGHGCYGGDNFMAKNGNPDIKKP